MRIPAHTISHVVTFVTIMLLGPASSPLAQGQTPQQSIVPSETSAELFQVVPGASSEQDMAAEEHDRLWMISTRRLTSDVCRIDLDNPALEVSRFTCEGLCESSSLEEYLQTINHGRPVVIYVHGNRLEPHEAIFRAIAIYQSTANQSCRAPIDWVLWSWPSAQEGILIRDFRRKADRTDAQGLYLAWLLRQHTQSSKPTSMIGYSFGAPVVIGALHALAGGSLHGRRLPGPEITGANIRVGLVAPAMASDWMVPRGYHGKATQNIDRLLLLYNRRDAVLKRYWLIDVLRGERALGYTGPKSFGPRIDGSKLPLRSRDCAAYIGLQHSEVDYYTSRCHAGSEMASLIHDTQLRP